MSRPNNGKPNDQQRESQDYLAKQGEAAQAESELVRQYKETVAPVASVQRNGME
ncbi:MAG: hypothetical protein K0R47_2566 [Brevibacillus sp.]|jgi:hypothetical protein|nr:hypothetical protein [Brevibacillus sp.]